jgi:hypothetical protein
VTIRSSFGLWRNATHFERCHDARHHVSRARASRLAAASRIDAEPSKRSQSNLLEQEDLLHHRPGVQLHHLGDEQPVLQVPAVHLREQPSLQLPELGVVARRYRVTPGIDRAKLAREQAEFRHFA